MAAVLLGMGSAWATAPLRAQSFVDLVAPTSDVCVPAAFGNAPGLSFEYQISSAFGSFTPVTASCLRGWGLPGYGSLSSAFWSPGVNSSSASNDVAQIVARATAPSEFVSLHSIDVARWSLAGSYPEVLGVRVYDLLGSELFSATRGVGPRGANGLFDVQTFAPNVGAVGGLIVQFGEDPWWIAANNLRFGLGVDLSTPVPEPGVAPLLVLGVLGLVMARRRRSTPTDKAGDGGISIVQRVRRSMPALAVSYGCVTLILTASPLVAQPSQLQTLLVGGGQSSCLYDGPAGGTFPVCQVDADGRFTLELVNDGSRSIGRGFISSGPGVLRSGAWLDVSNLPVSVGSPLMFSRAALLEPVTFASTIRPARMDLRFLVTGAISHSHPQRIGSYGVISLSTFLDQGRLQAFSDVVGGTLGSRPLGSEFTQSFLVPTFGAFEILFNLTAVARLDAPAGLTVDQRWSGSAMADFTNTLSITGARYFDDLGRDITSQVDLRFGSGFVPPRIVPEPSAVLLLMAGVMGLGVRQVARRQPRAREHG